MLAQYSVINQGEDLKPSQHQLTRMFSTVGIVSCQHLLQDGVLAPFLELHVVLCQHLLQNSRPTASPIISLGGANLYKTDLGLNIYVIKHIYMLHLVRITGAI